MYVPVEVGKAGQLKAVVSRFVSTEYEIKWNSLLREYGPKSIIWLDINTLWKREGDFCEWEYCVAEEFGGYEECWYRMDEGTVTSTLH